MSNIKRLSCYITNIEIKEGPVSHYRPSQPTEYLVKNTDERNEWVFNLSTELMVPKEWFSFTLCGDVKLKTLNYDTESDSFFDLNQYTITDRLMCLRVRQFITAHVIDLNRNSTYKGFILADLEF